MPDPQDRIENWTGKTIMVFCAHQDDDMACAGTTARLAANGNKVLLVFYTNGNKGTQDPKITSERLAEIRKQEEVEACAELGVPAENITCLGYDDGELEYADRKELCGKVCRLIRTHRPDACLCFDPGDLYEVFHKTDHRTAAFMTVDAARAANWPLYYPEQRLYEKLEPFRVREFMFFGSPDGDYEVDISTTIAQKLRARSKYVSQWGPGLYNYKPGRSPEELAELEKQIREAEGKKHVEKFRRGGARY